jgi:hypothetical protein
MGQAIPRGAAKDSYNTLPYFTQKETGHRVSRELPWLNQVKQERLKGNCY